MARKSLWTFFILLLGVTMLFGGGLNQTYDTTLNTYTVENESQTVTYSDPVFVAKADTAEAFNDTITIYNSTDAKLVAGTDYNWNSENGSVEYMNTTNTSSGETTTVTYSYDDQSDSTEFGGTSMQLGGMLIALLLLAVAGRFVMSSMWGWD